MVAITRDSINLYFNTLIPLPEGNALSKEGFAALAGWSEQQEWWGDFVKMHCLTETWRASCMGDPYQFALTLFRFITKHVTVIEAL